jgi:hypothetical protein
VDCSALLTHIARGPRAHDSPVHYTLALAETHVLTVAFAPVRVTRTAFAASCSCGWSADLTRTRWHQRAADLAEHVSQSADTETAAQFSAAAFMASMRAAPPFSMDR